MLHEFITTHREELIARCRDKASKRKLPLPDVTVSDGVALFIDQLANILRLEKESAGNDAVATAVAHAPSNVVLVAALHGEQLREQGYDLGQVVRAYGDVCQSVSDLAMALDMPFATGEFRTLSRCLDDAIAGAVAAHGALDQEVTANREASMHKHLRVLTTDHHRLVTIAIHAYAAIKAGHVGVTGATGALLGHSLDELSHLVEQAWPPLLDAPARLAD